MLSLLYHASSSQLGNVSGDASTVCMSLCLGVATLQPVTCALMYCLPDTVLFLGGGNLIAFVLGRLDAFQKFCYIGDTRVSIKRADC